MLSEFCDALSFVAPIFPLVRKPNNSTHKPLASTPLAPRGSRKTPLPPIGNALHINQFKGLAGVTLAGGAICPGTPLDPLRQGPTGIQTAE